MQHLLRTGLSPPLAGLSRTVLLDKSQLLAPLELLRALPSYNCESLDSKLTKDSLWALPFSLAATWGMIPMLSIGISNYSNF